MTTRLAAALCAVALVAAGSGCAGIKAQQRSARLEKQLDTVRYRQPLDDVWLEVRKLLAERDYPLADKDAQAVGQKPMSFAKRLFSPEMETYQLSDDVGLLQQVGMASRDKTVKGYALETGWHEGTPRYRARAEAAEGPDGVAVRLWQIPEDVLDHRDVPARDPELELALAKRLDAEAAQRAEAAADAKK